MTIEQDWHLNNENKDARKLNEIVTSLAKKLKTAVMNAKDEEEKKTAEHSVENEADQQPQKKKKKIKTLC